MREHQLRFWEGCSVSRFLDLRRATGALPGSKSFRNQLIDAVHLWCAEEVGADYVMTCDYDLQRRLARSRLLYPPKVVTPRELQRQLRSAGHCRWTDELAYVWDRVRSQLRPGKGSSPYDDLVRLGNLLEQHAYYDE